MQGTDMLLQEAEDRRKAMAGELDKAIRRIGALEDDRVRLIEGMAQLFPASNWTIPDDLDFDQATKETVTSVLSQVRRLQKSLKGSEEARLAGEQKLAGLQTRLDNEHRAAKLAVAIANIRSGYAQEFISAARLARVWYASYRIRVAENGMPSGLPWEDLSEQDRAEIMLIATDVQKAYESMLNERSGIVDQMTEGILGDGDELATAIRQLALIAEGGKAVWDLFVKINRTLALEGFSFLPPGTIVHGATPSVRPHRPD